MTAAHYPLSNYSMKLSKKVPKSLVALAALVAIGAGAGVAGIASAQTATGTTGTTQTQGAHRGPGVRGTVASINGNTLTVTGKDNTTYIVDVSGAKVLKGTAGAAPTTGSVSDIKVGDTVGVRGTVTGVNVTATEVMDGIGGRGMGMMGGRGSMHGEGRGVMGKVTAVNGSTLTITNTDGTSYTVDASAAKVSKTTDITVGDIQVGDTVGVMGTLSGSSVKAVHIMDGVPPTPQAPPTTTQ